MNEAERLNSFTATESASGMAEAGTAWVIPELKEGLIEYED